MGTNVSPANAVPCERSTAWDIQEEERLYNYRRGADDVDSVIGGNDGASLLYCR